MRRRGNKEKKLRLAKAVLQQEKSSKNESLMTKENTG
jgi:hypothetical protein